MSLSQFPAFNWDHSTQSCLLPSQGSFRALKSRYQLHTTMVCKLLYSPAPQPAPNHCSQIVHDRSRSSCWCYISVGLEGGLDVHMDQKSISCCSRSCCLSHCARDTSTNKINIWPVMWVIPTPSSTNTWNPLGLGLETKWRVEFTFGNCPARNSSLLSFPVCQQD